MTIHEFGKQNDNVVVLIHPSLVMWDYFEYLVPFMEKNHRLIIPALPGYDDASPGNFTSIEIIASELEDWLLTNGISKISSIYGCSMGGSVVARFLADNRVIADSAVIDGGITPYQVPRILTRPIALRDFLMIYMGKIGGIKLLEKAFKTDEYSEEDLLYIEKILNFISAKTIWRTFDSCNNYAMPDKITTDCGYIEYWYTKTEKKARKLDIRYFRNNLPQTVFKKFEDIGHGGLAVLKPEFMAAELERCMANSQ